MAEIKSHEFDGFLSTASRRYRLFVVYGPDRGLVAERAAAVAAKTGIRLDDPFAVLKIDASEIGGDAGRLIDELNAIGLFGGEKLVWVRDAANEKGLIEALQFLGDHPPGESVLIVEAGDIKKTSALRKLSDGARAIASIPCYADDVRALNALIDQELSGEGLRISPDARAMLLELIGGDRIASRNEVRKLALYCRGAETIDESRVGEIIGDASAISTDEAIDAILKGDLDGFLHAAQKVIGSKTPIFLVLQGCLRQFQLIDSMRAEMDDKRLQSSQVMQTLGRHLHFKRKPIIEQALRNWSSAAIAREMGRLQAAILESRRRPSLGDTIALQTLLSTTLQSSRGTQQSSR
jgi:DNA polymerase-3 subunit delta